MILKYIKAIKVTRPRLSRLSKIPRLLLMPPRLTTTQGSNGIKMRIETISVQFKVKYLNKLTLVTIFKTFNSYSK